MRTVDLRITNESEYRAWDASMNGINGAFGVVNLLGPRAPGRPRFWRQSVTFVDLRFTFVDSASGADIVLPRTYISFFDLDTAPTGAARECVRALTLQPYMCNHAACVARGLCGGPCMCVGVRAVACNPRESALTHLCSR